MIRHRHCPMLLRFSLPHSFGLFLAILIVAISPDVQAQNASSSIGQVDLDQVKKLILPKASESKWLSINWETDLWKARKQAAKLGKPILLWEMDGNPMGCT